MLEEEYCAFIPVSKNIWIATKLISNAINEFSKGYFLLDRKHYLMSEDGKLFDFYSTVKKCGIKNGDTLLLV